jgi:hypothetical protein
MNLAEFRDHLDARGADLSAWLDAHRRAADRLLATDPSARACLAQAERLEQLIGRDRARGAPAIAAAAARVLAGLPRELPPQRRFGLAWLWPAALLDADLAPARLRIASLAAVGCLGIVLGLAGPDIAGDAGFVVASASPETNLAAVFEPEALTGVRP